MSEPIWVLVTAAVLIVMGMALFTWRLQQSDPASHTRRVAELRLANTTALLLAATGAVYVGLAVAGSATPAAAIDIAIGLVCLGAGGVALHRDPRESLLLLTAAFTLHALVDIAHRPGGLPPEVVPRWYSVGCAVFNVGIAALCYWARRR